jgi:hypothetical protein
MSDGERTTVRSSDPGADAAAAGARTRSEAATLVCAVTVAVVLGVACGIWVNSLLAASAASAGWPAPSRLPPGARADAPPPAEETKAPQSSVETAGTPAAAEESAAAVVESRTLKPAATPAPTPAGRGAKTDARAAVAPGVLKGAEPVRGQGRTSPCALYASASSLTIRGGGAASLVLGGPGESGALNVSTQSWADIAVFREGPAPGGNGWVRYTVKSVSRRPGLYAIHFSTRCGSQTINVTVK